MPRPTMVDKIRDVLAAEMGTPLFPVGTKLPNEQLLAERFEVSRATIREAVRGLVERGQVSRVHGSGTFVTASRPRHSLDTSLSYTAMIEEAGFEAAQVSLGLRTRVADENERLQLRLPEGAEVLEVERVRTADHLEVVYSRDRIPADLLPAAAVTGPSLHRALASVGIHVRTASAQLSPVLADRRLAEVLRRKPGTPLLHLEQTDFDQNGRAVMLSSEWHVSDVFELRIHRRADSR
jgi:GntR family transcriptional regulator